MGNGFLRLGLMALACCLTLGAGYAHAQNGGGGPIAFNPPDGCVTPAARALAEGLIEDYEVKFGPISTPIIGRTSPPLTFYPMAGDLWGDVFTINYVDLDPSSGFHDWDCLGYTYDGHRGIDTMIRTFDEQVIGVPVFAALSGTVIAVHDGEPDMNTVWADQTSNFVIIDHGLGRQGWYYHLRKDSILVGVSEFVSGGQQIAQCGSSGNSTGPHLHFEIVENDEPYEPFAGPCRSGDSGWYVQPEPVREVYLQDFGLTHQSLSGLPGWPNRWPASGQIALSDPALRVWFYGTNLPAQSTWQVRFRRPDGTLTAAGAVQNFNNAFWRWFSWWWTYDVPEMHVTTGTWRVLVYINGALQVEAPIEVRTERTPDFNRPPEEVHLHFDPPAPLAGFAATMVVETSTTVDDPDYDVLRYHYTWTVNGEVARDVTTAARSDVLPRGMVKASDMVGCSVTPTDGTLDGETKMLVAQVSSPPIPTVGGVAAAGMALALVGAAAWVLARSAKRSQAWQPASSEPQ